MELQELKNQWTSVDERLKKQEVLNTQMVEKILKDKSKGALSKLKNMEKLEVVVLFFVTYFAIWLLNSNLHSDLFFREITLIVGIAVGFIGIVLGCYALMRYLAKIDFSKNIKDNSLFMSRYSIFYRKKKMANYFIIIPVMFLLLALFIYERGAYLHFWIIFIVGLLIAIGGSMRTYRVYEKKIQTIKEGLAELSELDE